jgi:hypothetical protein
MRWKTMALAGAAWPAIAGCNIAYNAARNIVNEPQVVLTKLGIEHDLRREARETWQQVRVEYPRRAFTTEFRDGFIDGYVDYLDRGGIGSLPAVPPSKYTRHKKYFTENGQCLVKDYFLGFKYGQEIAIATGKRQFLTVPVLLPQPPVQPPAFTIQPPATFTFPPPDPVRPPVPIHPAPGSDSPPVVPPPQSGTSMLPSPRPLAKPGVTTPQVSKFATEEPRPNPDQLPKPNPPLPVPTWPAAGASDPNPPPAIEVPTVASTPATPATRLPAPPREVPEFPAHVPTPSVLDEVPIILPEHTMPPVVLPSHPEQPK